MREVAMREVAMRGRDPVGVDAIRRWHDGLTESLAVESHEWLEARLHERGLAFGARALCTVVRPRFLTVGEHEKLRADVGLLLRAFATAHAAAMVDPVHRAQFMLAEWEEQLLHTDVALDHGSPLGRMDCFFQPDGTLRVTEYNAETPAGTAYGDALTELFLAMPAMRPFLAEWVVRPLPARHNVLHALLAAHERITGHRRPTGVAIVDWDEVPTRSEFEMFRQYFASMGFPTVIVDPRALTYEHGKLMAGGRQITLVYKRVLLHELVERLGLDTPLVRAVKARDVALVNSFRCKLLHKKASLAFLSDTDHAGLFSGDELAAIHGLVPWTRRVSERWTTYDGADVDLVPFMQANRARLVLKPNDDYGGAGIVLGWTVDGAAWEQAIAKALAEPYIVQERIALPKEPYASVHDGRLHIADRIVDTAPFTFHGSYVDGCLTRVSTAQLVNVTAGGGSTVPTFVVEPR